MPFVGPIRMLSICIAPPARPNRPHACLFGQSAVVLVQQNSRETWYDPSFGFGPHDSLLNYEMICWARRETRRHLRHHRWKRSETPRLRILRTQSYSAPHPAPASTDPKPSTA